MAPIFIDTNVFLRHLTEDHGEFSPKASAFLGRIERGEETGQTADTAVFEAVFTLEKTYGRTKPEIADSLRSLIELPGILLPAKQRLFRAFDLYVGLNMSFGDAFHVAVMQQIGITAIASFDRDFDRVPGITRVEPS